MKAPVNMPKAGPTQKNLSPGLVSKKVTTKPTTPTKKSIAPKVWQNVIVSAEIIVILLWWFFIQGANNI